MNAVLSGAEIRAQRGIEDENCVIVLGCGPAGLLAAHAVKLAGREPIIFSAKKEKSIIPGAAYLHKPVPDITSRESDGELRYIKKGEQGGYAEKVYGDWQHPCSWDDFESGIYPAWSMREAYDRLWEEYNYLIVPQSVSAEEVEGLLVDFPLVISSIPAQAICKGGGHLFHHKNYWHVPKAVWWVPENSLVYNGFREDIWYRSSRIFGFEATEFPRIPVANEWWRTLSGVNKESWPNPVEGIKPLSNNCDCWRDSNFLRVGRFGKWEKGVLAHQAFEDAFKHMFEVFEGA